MSGRQFTKPWINLSEDEIAIAESCFVHYVDIRGADQVLGHFGFPVALRRAMEAINEHRKRMNKPGLEQLPDISPAHECSSRGQNRPMRGSPRSEHAVGIPTDRAATLDANRGRLIALDRANDELLTIEGDPNDANL